jgi:hypothetical protein
MEKNESLQMRVVGDDYIDALMEKFEGGIEYPIPNPGFNMSMVKSRFNTYIFSIRIVMPYKNLLTRKLLVPGISDRMFKLKKLEIIFDDEHKSDSFFWDWTNNF